MKRSTTTAAVQLVYPFWFACPGSHSLPPFGPYFHPSFPAASHSRPKPMHNRWENADKHRRLEHQTRMATYNMSGGHHVAGFQFIMCLSATDNQMGCFKTFCISAGSSSSSSSSPLLSSSPSSVGSALGGCESLMMLLMILGGQRSSETDG